METMTAAKRAYVPRLRNLLCLKREGNNVIVNQVLCHTREQAVIERRVLPRYLNGLHCQHRAMRFANGHSEALRTVDSVIAERLQANGHGQQHREDVARYMTQLIDSCIDTRSRASRTFLHGSVPLKTYLPDSDVDLCVMIAPGRASDWSARCMEKLLPLALAQRQRARSSPQSGIGGGGEHAFNVNNVSFINAAVPLVTCSVNGLVVDISAGHPNAVRAVALFEQVDRLVGRDNLFKRSVLLIKAYARKQALLPRANRGGLSTYALNLMVASIFNVGEEEVEHPLHALLLFLKTYARFDWTRDYLAIDGTHVIEDRSAPLAGGAGHGARPRLAIQLSPSRRGADRDATRAAGAKRADAAGGGRPAADPSTWPCHIADPLDATNDLGRSCSAEVLQRFQSALLRSYELLGAALLTATRPDESVSMIDSLLAGVCAAYRVRGYESGGGGGRSGRKKSRRRGGRGGGGNGNTPLQPNARPFSPVISLAGKYQVLSDDAVRASILIEGNSPPRSMSPVRSDVAAPPPILGRASEASTSGRAPPSAAAPAASPPSSPTSPTKATAAASIAFLQKRMSWIVQGILWAGLYLLVLRQTGGEGGSRGAMNDSSVARPGAPKHSGAPHDTAHDAARGPRGSGGDAARMQRRATEWESAPASEVRVAPPPEPLLCHPIFGDIAAKDYPVFARAMPAAAQVVQVGSMIAFDVRCNPPCSVRAHSMLACECFCVVACVVHRLCRPRARAARARRAACQAKCARRSSKARTNLFLLLLRHAPALSLSLSLSLSFHPGHRRAKARSRGATAARVSFNGSALRRPLPAWAAQACAAAARGAATPASCCSPLAHKPSYSLPSMWKTVASTGARSIRSSLRASSCASLAPPRSPIRSVT